MSSPVRRAFLLLRQHFLLISGPWLVVCAAGFAVLKVVQQIMSRMYPVFDTRTLRGMGHQQMNAAVLTSQRANFIRLGAIECVAVLEGAFEVLALAVMVLLVARIAAQGEDTVAAALGRLRNIPGVAGTLLKFYAIALAIGLGTMVIAILPAFLIVPMRLSLHWPFQIVRWVTWISAEAGTLLFVCCVMPFLLDAVWRLQRPESPDEDAPPGLLARAIGYGVVAICIEIAVRLPSRLLQASLPHTPGTGPSIGQYAFGLATVLLTALPAIVCIVAITLLVMSAEERVEVESAA